MEIGQKVIKSEDFEVGCWYLLGGVGSVYYIQLKKYDSSGFIATRYIYNGYFRLGGNFGKLNNYSFTKVDKNIPEIQNYLPIEERNLIINNYLIY